MKVSIIIPVLNGEPFIREAIESARAQTQPPMEILVVDNGSTDRTVEIVSAYGEPVRVFYETVPSASAARSTGAAAAGGDALMFLDADDIIGPTVLEELSAVLLMHPGAVACCPWKRYEQIAGSWEVRPPSCTRRIGGQHPLAAWLNGWYHPPCSVLWSAEAYVRSGGWNPARNPNDDGDLMMRALVEGVPLIRTAEGVAYYRRLPDGAISLSGQRFTSSGLAARLNVIEGIEERLRSRGSIDSFRVALRNAYSCIARDAVGERALVERAERGMERVSPTLIDLAQEAVMRVRDRLGLAADSPEFNRHGMNR